LGVQGIPMIAFLSVFKKKIIVSNVGGLEWERPKFGYFTKLYLKFCFELSFIFSKYVILDNQHYNVFAPKKSNAKVVVLPYGGEIDSSLNSTSELLEKYPFLNDNYYLSISRSLEDNFIGELCETFLNLDQKLVMISNFSSTKYGRMVFEKYSNNDNLILINGLYVKPELDLVRRKCAAYIHTHTLCGTAPSLVEMIISQRPIIAVDIPQNRYTLHNHGFYYKNFNDLKEFLAKSNDLDVYVPPIEICRQFEWDLIVGNYQNLYN
jgi:glycosyltransferase involved in cell wall biosynthesis